MVELSANGCRTDRWRLVPQEFYGRSTLRVARELLGKILVVSSATNGKREVTAGRIVETEAYRENDPACHAWVGKTPRNEIMFGEPGRVYVYFIYGMYEMFNLVTEAKGKPAAVLIRALEPLSGIEAMRKRRPHVRAERDLLNGPGRLARAMGIKLAHKGESAQGPNISIFDDGFKPKSVTVSPRVGISCGQENLWRYYLTEHPCVSKAPQNKLGKVLS
ncbi:MAG: DNA-3-methyladenine glycosylase [Bdellovibrionia bacterium]